MTILIRPIADTVIEPEGDRKAVTTAINSSNPSSTSNICVGSRLRVRRISRGMTEKELSEKLEIDRDDVDAYENGVKRISANLLLRIAKLLDVPPGHFFQGHTTEELSDCLRSSP
jgi:plasmid maintenance system antidote protein VapI